jgi:hypothetical protein
LFKLVSFPLAARPAAIVFLLNSHGFLASREHTFKLSRSLSNDLHQGCTNGAVFVGVEFKLTTLSQTEAHSANSASLSQLKLGQVSHPSQFFDLHRFDSSVEMAILPLIVIFSSHCKRYQCK